MRVGEIESCLKAKFKDKLNSVIINKNQEIHDLLTDSRNHFNPDHTVFFAIRTPGGNDGHRYMAELYQKGIRNFVCEYIPDDFKASDVNIFLVPDTIEALTEIGRSRRSNAKEITAITGSRGKTTLKEILFQLMEPYSTISRSPRSYNSKIGVPLSLWQIPPATDLAIIETGISQRGEMRPHALSINPDTVIFTNIGDAHSQGFESKKEKAAEKALLAFAPNVKRVIFSLDDPYLTEALKSLPDSVEKIRWSEKDPEAEIFIKRNSEGFEYKWEGKVYAVNKELEKSYDLENLAGALAFMLAQGFSPEEINKDFQKLTRIGTRLNVVDGINGCSVIIDSYTSDLSSLLPAVDFMKRRKRPDQTVTLIVSDLHHEVNSVESTYKEISRLVADTRIDKFIGIGETFKSFDHLFPSSKIYRCTEEFLEEFSLADYNDEIILLKGSPEYGFEKIREQLEAKKHETVLEVNLDSILRNYNYFKSYVPSSTGIIAMVKASGYGAGSYEIAKTLQDAGAAYLAVAALDEGIDLRNNGIVMPIMVMNPRAANYRALFRNKLEPVIYSVEMLKTLTEEAGKYGQEEYPVHLKLDTGMHRMGFEDKDIPKLLELLKKSDKIKVASIFSHLATADCLDMDEYTLRQLNRFEKMSATIIEGIGYTTKRHILNSAGILRFPEFHYDLVRLGIGLYGANTLPENIEKPLAVVSTLRTVIICIREIEGDEAVGYSRKGKIEGRRKIATLPIGYADGMNRKFGNGALKVFVNGSYAPTIGNICMDATMIDVTGIDCKEGDSVEIFGEKVSLSDLADTIETIPYEVLTSVSPRVKRVYYRE